MATPARVVRLICPTCHRGHWTIDKDYRGAHLAGLKELHYYQRRYRCPKCQTVSTGFLVIFKSPTAVGAGSWLFDWMQRRFVPDDARSQAD